MSQTQIANVEMTSGNELIMKVVIDQHNEPRKKVKWYKGKKFVTIVTDVNIRSLQNYPQLLDYDEVNPREPNEKSAPSKRMKNTLENEKDDIFSTLNGGVLMSVKSSKIYRDSESGLKIMEIILSDLELHGIIDGGHTLDVIMLTNEIAAEFQHVSVEFAINLERDLVERLAETRNTRTQVSQISLADHRGELEPIKNALSNEWYSRDIAYVQNEKGTIRCDRHIIPLITALNPTLSESDIRKSYISVGSCLEIYLNQSNFINQFKDLLPGILVFQDYLKESIPTTYNFYGYSADGKELKEAPGRYKYRSLTNIEKKPDEKLIFTKGDRKSPYVPRAFYLPIIAAMRHALRLNENTNKYEWKVEPKDIYEDNKKSFNNIIFKYYYLKAQNPNATGKVKHLWEEMDKLVMDYLRGIQSKQDQERLALLEKMAKDLGINF